MKPQPNPNGFAVPTLKGRELTQSQYDNLPDAEKNVVVRRVNGPHHDAKWAKHARWKEKYAAHARTFFGSRIKWHAIDELVPVTGSA